MQITKNLNEYLIMSMISRHELINFKLCLDVKYKHQENVTLRNLENFENLAAEHCRKTQFFLVFTIYRIL